MATSSKVVFKLETLKKQALESIDFRIGQAQLEVDSYDDDEALTERIAAWRSEQEIKLRDLVSRLHQVGDHQLSRFKLAPIPEVDRWERSRAATKLRELEARRSEIIAKSESLVPDADGNISLTKIQLRDFFGL